MGLPVAELLFCVVVIRVNEAAGLCHRDHPTSACLSGMEHGPPLHPGCLHLKPIRFYFQLSFHGFILSWKSGGWRSECCGFTCKEPPSPTTGSGCRHGLLRARDAEMFGLF